MAVLGAGELHVVVLAHDQGHANGEEDQGQLHLRKIHRIRAEDFRGMGHRRRTFEIQVRRCRRQPKRRRLMDRRIKDRPLL